MANPQANARSRMLNRLRNGRASVPGTYMSAAGIQSELSPNCLHKVAVHEATYRKHVRGYRQDLQQQVDKLKKSQNLLRKSLVGYRQKRREHETKRYRSPELSAFPDSRPTTPDSPRDITRPPRQLLIVVDEEGQTGKPVLLMRKPRKQKRRKNTTRDREKSDTVEDSREGEDYNVRGKHDSFGSSDSGIGLDIDVNNVHNISAHSAPVYSPDTHAQHEEQTQISRDVSIENTMVSENVSVRGTDKYKLEMTRTQSTDLPVKSPEPTNQNKARTRRRVTVNRSPLKGMMASQSLDDLPGTKTKRGRRRHKSSNRSQDSGEAKMAASQSSPPSADTHRDLAESHDAPPTSREIVDAWVFTRQKAQHAGNNNQSDTSTFMQLVRMKQNMSMSKNINMIDKLISGSRNKRLLYLRRISEVSNPPLAALEGAHVQCEVEEGEEESQGGGGEQRRVGTQASPTGYTTPPEISSDQIDGSPQHGSPSHRRTKYVRLPPLDTDDSNMPSNPIEDKFKRALRKTSVSAMQPGVLQQTSSAGVVPGVGGMEQDAQDYPSVAPGGPPPRPRPRATAEVMLPSEQVANRNVERFIRSETRRLSSVARDVTWQESLAKLRAVHTVFPAKIIQEKGFSV